MAWIGPAIGAVAGFLGQDDTNDSNRQIAEQNSAFNADQARINREFQAGQSQNQMDFQERMSGSSYQRAIRDMQAAGLNPMLAYSQGGATTPGGSAASGAQGQAVQPPPMQNKYAQAVASAQQVASLEVQKATARDTNASAAIKESEVDPAGTNRPDTATAQLKRQQAYTEAQRAVNLTRDSDRLEQVVRNLGEQLALTNTETQKVMEEILNLREHGKSINLDNLFKVLDIDRHRNQAEFERSWVGRNYRYTQPIVDQAGRLVNSAATVRGMFPRKFQNETTTQRYPDGHSTYSEGSR